MNFDPFFQLFGGALALFYDLVPNYGFIIIALTLVVMLIVTPLTLKATRSMMMMQQLQPEMKKLQSKYKDDRQKLNEELLKFYKENNINPVGGCLPLFIQMPVFVLLYTVLRGLTLRVPSMGSNTGWVLGQQQLGINPVPHPPDVAQYHNFQPMYLPADSQLEAALSNTNVMNFFGMDLASSCSEVFSRQGVVASIPYVVLIIIVGATSFIQQRQIQGRNPGAQINPQQQQLMKIMPFFLPIFSIALPSGLVLYFAVSNLYRVGQQWFIGRTIYGTGKGGSGERAAKELSSSGSSEDKPARRGGAAAPTTRPTKSAKSAPANKAGDKTPAKGREASDKADESKTSRSKTAQTSASSSGGRAKGGSARADKASDATRSRGSSRTGGRPPQGKPEPKPAGKGGTGAAGRNGAASNKDSNGSAPGGGDGGSPTLQPRARKKKR